MTMIVLPYAPNGALRIMFEMVEMGGREVHAISVGKNGMTARDGDDFTSFESMPGAMSGSVDPFRLCEVPIEEEKKLGWKIRPS